MLRGAAVVATWEGHAVCEALAERPWEALCGSHGRMVGWGPLVPFP